MKATAIKVIAWARATARAVLTASIFAAAAMICTPQCMAADKETKGKPAATAKDKDQDKAEKDKAAKAAADKAAAKAAAAQAAAQRAARDKAAADRARAVQEAETKLAATKYAIQEAEIALAAAERTLSQRASAERTAASRAASAKAVADKNPDPKSAAQRAAAAAKTAADNATEQRVAAEKEVAAKTAQLRNAAAEAHLAEATALGGLKPLPADAWDYAKARHLLVRAGFGGTPDEVARLHALGLHGAVDYLVDYDKLPALDLPFHAVKPERPQVGERYLGPEQRQELSRERRRVDQEQMTELRNWWYQRLVQSPRPLQEKLVVFWHNHFATEYRTTRLSYAMYLQNELLREHAAGNFGALLHGIVHDPAMLRYLDNNRNVKGRPNENLAREIMELFSMGEGNYTERDIKEAARALTGYTYEPYSVQFRYVARDHDNENKSIFGRTGNWCGDDLVDLILQQPHTARFIAGKMFSYFAHENAGDETIDQLAAVLRGRQYELSPMLKNLFLSEEFYSDRSMSTQIKSPVQLAIGTLRDLGAKETNYGLLASVCRDMGQDLFDPPNVKGWEGGQTWVNSNRVFTRYNSVADLVERFTLPDGQRGVDVVAALEGKQLNSAGEIVDYLAKSCLLISLSEGQRAALVEFLGDMPVSKEDWDSQREQLNVRLRALLVHMLTIPEHQLT